MLHGNIQAELYPYLCDEIPTVKPFATTMLNAGDITWLSPTLNQVHKLTNPKESAHTCVTIQCYAYEVTDATHYDYFDYVGDSGNKKQYEPDSDMDFLKFKETMKKEWENREPVKKPQPEVHVRNAFSQCVRDYLCCCFAH